jgi:hypothetical protein
MSNLVVANLLDGRVVKGTSLDVDPARPVCHIRTATGMEKVRLADAKALFFVRSLTGNKDRNDVQQVQPEDVRAKGSARIDLVFKDGERIAAFTNRYPPRGAFFFVVPVDTGSNNTRVLVNAAALVSMAPGVETAAS